MNSNRIKLLVGAIGVVGLLVASGAVAATAANAPAEITLDKCKKKKSGVKFNHAKHANDLKIACDTCHHTQKGLKAGSATEVPTCTSCHLNPKDNALDCTSSSTKKNPYHVNCMGCHKEEAKKDPAKKDLKKCSACHE